MGNYRYKPSSHSENRMSHEGDMENARAQYFGDASLNLKFLLEKRFGWMNTYIKNEDHGVEVGSGTGLSKLFIRCRNYRITDKNENEWLDDKLVDPMHTPYNDSSLDFVISSNMMHSLPYPIVFLSEMNRILKPGGVLIIQEVNASWFMRRILRMMKHKGYDFNSNVFDRNVSCTDSEDPLSANCAIPNLLFDDRERFEKNIPDFKIEYSGFSEFFLFLNSGGVVAKTRFVRLPRFLLKLISGIDRILIRISPSTFAMQRQIVLRKKG